MKAAVVAAEEKRKATDPIIVGLHNEQAALEKHVTESCRKLLGKSPSSPDLFDESLIWDVHSFADV